MDDHALKGYAKNKAWGVQHNRDLLKGTAFNNDYSKRMKTKIAEYRRHFSLISNSYLKGTTFDAKHINQMLSSEFAGIKKPKIINDYSPINLSSVNQVENSTRNASITQSMDAKEEVHPLKSILHKKHRSVGGRKSLDPEAMIHATNVRFSASFLTPERGSMTQMHFVEMYNCPAVQIAAKDKSFENIYEKQFESTALNDYLSTEREVRNKVKHYEVPSQEDLELKSSKVRRLEHQKLKTELLQSQELKNNLRFLGKRERILK